MFPSQLIDIQFKQVEHKFWRIEKLHLLFEVSAQTMCVFFRSRDHLEKSFSRCSLQ